VFDAKSYQSFSFGNIWCSLVLKIGIFYTYFYGSGRFCSKRIKLRKKKKHSSQLLSLHLIKILTFNPFGSPPSVIKFIVIFVKTGKLVQKLK